MNTTFDLLKPEDVAKRLNIAVSTVYKFAHQGMIPCVKLGRAIRFRPESLAKLLDQQERVAYAKVA